MKPCRRCELIVAFVARHADEYGYGPTIREIGTAARLASVSAVLRHLDVHLVPAGKLVRDPHVARSIRRPRKVSP